MKLAQYLEGLRAASTAAELEAAIQAPYEHRFSGRTWTAICKVRVERGRAICDGHPHGAFVPRLDGRSLTVCGQSYRVGRGSWHSSGRFAKDVLKNNGFSQRAASRIWGCWGDYPHRCLSIIELALNGGLADPPMDTLIYSGEGHGPVNISVEGNAADDWDRRATLACKCGGTLFDWGAGFSDDFTLVNWHCNRCRDVYVEYVTPSRFAQIRPPRLSVAPRAGSISDLTQTLS